MKKSAKTERNNPAIGRNKRNIGKKKQSLNTLGRKI